MSLTYICGEIMLTSWKQTRTSFEHAINDGEALGGRRKTKKNGLNGSNTVGTKADVVGGVFVQPFAQDDPSFLERNNPSSAIAKKKRRKQGRSGYSDATSMDVEPLICLTSQHRVAVLGKGKDGNLVESKSRTYVTRPGAGAQFSTSGTTKDASFAGMPRLGAKYDPGSNLIYAIRNNGAEVVVWSAAPSSVISGPDDKVVDSSKVNGMKLEPAGSNQSKKKRKSEHRDSDAPAFSAHAVISQRLQLPEGKIAVSLTPFSTTSPSTQGKNPLTLIGASGCCEDGSIWIATISANGTSDNEPFLLTIVDGSSFHQNEDNRRRSGKSRTGNTEWRILDSRVACVIESKGRKGSNNDSGFLLSIHSVILSEVSGKVAYHKQHVGISTKDGDWSVSKVKKSTLVDVLKLPQQKDREVAAILDSNENCIIIHRSDDGSGWMLTSANQSDENLTKSTFQLNCNSNESVFSFGNVCSNITAIFTSDIDTPVLKLVDFERRAEISSTSLNRILTDKKCLSMITSEIDGSIALLASPEESGSVEVLHSKIDVGSIAQRTSFGKGMSLASTLRLVAQSSISARDSTEIISKQQATTNFGDVIHCCEIIGKAGNTKAIDEIVSEACTLLVAGAKSLTEAEQEAESQPTNGKRRKGKQARKTGDLPSKWDTLYNQSCEMITNAQKGQLPKAFVDVAFRESARLLLSSRKELHQDALDVLLSTLRTKSVSAREDHNIESHRDHLLLRLLKCTSKSQEGQSQGSIGKLDLVDAILSNVVDIPEDVLVSILRFVLRNVNVEDAIAYNERSDQSKLQNESKGDSSMRVLSQTLLNLTAMIVTNSKCNHSFLTKAMQEHIRGSAEVEIILATLSKLLKSGNIHGNKDCISDRASLSMGAIEWITAVTDAHMSTVVKMTSDGGLVLNKVQTAISSAMSQSEVAHELKELADHSESLASSLEASAVVAKTSITTESTSNDTIVSPYSIERLAF